MSLLGKIQCICVHGYSHCCFRHLVDSGWHIQAAPYQPSDIIGDPLCHHGNSSLHLSFTHIVCCTQHCWLRLSSHTDCVPKCQPQSPTIWRGSTLSDVRRRAECFRSIHAVIQDIWPKLKHRQESKQERKRWRCRIIVVISSIFHNSGQSFYAVHH